MMDKSKLVARMHETMDDIAVELAASAVRQQLKKWNETGQLRHWWRPDMVSLRSLWERTSESVESGETQECLAYAALLLFREVIDDE